ncbi:COX15-CtaA-domain-containing protein [Xylona heveae TC161]|uniref:COX15-CtaA-domain-containing protein n=1 Tax=Xylona heveae (strain CBS 132557 / TC161) TaxID=1328760 RepID=A0A165FMS4_XYLHT|nr:COX15-CtaA-domain-containing protein [Xylona heveae TC161]KZF21167.1 COX15-CtaA-domain-containing protein [Xylona heveae TC161]
MASLLQPFPALRRGAPRLSREFFTCRACLRTGTGASVRAASSAASASALRSLNSAATARRPVFKSVGKTPFLQAFRSNSSHASSSTTTSPLGSLGKTIGGAASSTSSKTSSFPETSSKIVAYWLLGSAASVFGIVIFGGLTRLTESGLSITEWRPVTGSLPPMSADDWEAEFTKYKSSPEFALLNSKMDLPEFKKIYYMEWTHRLWGRFVGLSFLLPTIYFIARRRVSRPIARNLVGITLLIGFQGVLGWWMVKSGLKDDLFAPGSHPRVSQYRLTAHLGAAFLCYVAMLWNGLSILRENKLVADPVNGEKALNTLRLPQLKFFRRSVGALACLVFITAMSGALVAGLDAGLIYNEFPYMGLGLTPPKSELFSDFYSRKPDGSDIWWRNALENPSLVQLDHRVLATTAFTAIVSLWAYSRFSPAVRAALPRNARKGMLGVVHLASLQVVLGICTLLYLVPTHLAATHQAGALALLTGTVVLGSRVWIPSRAARLVAARLSRAASSSSSHAPRPTPRGFAAGSVGPIKSTS